MPAMRVVKYFAEEKKIYILFAVKCYQPLPLLPCIWKTFNGVHTWKGPPSIIIPDAAECAVTAPCFFVTDYFSIKSLIWSDFLRFSRQVLYISHQINCQYRSTQHFFVVVENLQSLKCIFAENYRTSKLDKRNADVVFCFFKEFGLILTSIRIYGHRPFKSLQHSQCV